MGLLGWKLAEPEQPGFRVPWFEIPKTEDLPALVTQNELCWMMTVLVV